MPQSVEKVKCLQARVDISLLIMSVPVPEGAVLTSSQSLKSAFKFAKVLCELLSVVF